MMDSNHHSNPLYPMGFTNSLTNFHPIKLLAKYHMHDLQLSLCHLKNSLFLLPLNNFIISNKLKDSKNPHYLKIQSYPNHVKNMS